MGIKDFFVGGVAESKPEIIVDAAAAPSPFVGSNTGWIYTRSTATREQALAIPTLSRARGIICSTIGSLPIEQYNKMSGAHVEPARVINQPDPRVPGAVIYSYIAEDLWLHGVAYGIVMETYREDNRVMSWTRVAPDRVTQELNSTGDTIVGYLVDGKRVPNVGVGSLIVFNGLAEGLLNTAGRTIRAAIALENASEAFAKEPVPLMVLKSNGTNLTKERIGKLLESWNAARSKRSTAFLNADVELQAMGIDPNKLQLNEARSYVALELCRAANLPAWFASADPTSTTYSNAINERRSLVDFSLRPILTAIEQRLDMPDLTPSTVKTRYDLDDFLRGNPLERAQVYEILNRIGAMSVEEIRKEEDLIQS